MEDTHIYDKVNLIDRYDLSVVKNELEIKINNIDKRVENIEETLSNHMVNMTVNIKNYKHIDIIKTNNKIDSIQKYLHLNIMCLDDDIKKLNDEYKRKERLYILIIGTIFCLYLLFTHLQLIYSP